MLWPWDIEQDEIEGRSPAPRRLPRPTWLFLTVDVLLSALVTHWWEGDRTVGAGSQWSWPWSWTPDLRSRRPVADLRSITGSLVIADGTVADRQVVLRPAPRCHAATGQRRTFRGAKERAPCPR